MNVILQISTNLFILRDLNVEKKNESLLGSVDLPHDIEDGPIGIL